MGYERHHAIAVTSFDHKALIAARECAVDLFSETDCAITEITPKAVNGRRSFFIAPDGSKEGWPESDAGDLARRRFVHWLRAQAFKDGSSFLSWVEVQYGDDCLETKIVSDSDQRRREAEGRV